MDFKTLHETIPYHIAGKQKSIRYEPYPNIVLAMPGRHAMDTTPPGGDFVVMVTDPVFALAEHQFTHTDIFKNVELMTFSSAMNNYMDFYHAVVKGTDPLLCPWDRAGIGGAIDPKTFFCAVQCLAVAEHRRYAQYEKKFGGRYLPFRFATGIYEGLWTAADAAGMQKKGRPGVEILEKIHGRPQLTQELME